MQRQEQTQFSSSVSFNETHCGLCGEDKADTIARTCGVCKRPFCNMKRRNCLEQHQKETGHTND